MQVISLILMAADETESDMLLRGFGRYPVEVVPSSPSYANYVKTLQYMPDAVLLEIAPRYSDQLHYIQMIKQNQKAMDIPLVGFGPRLESAVREGLLRVGLNRYIERPYDFNDIVKTLTELLGSPKSRVFGQAGLNGGQRGKEIERLLSADVAAAIKLNIITEHIGGLMAFPFVVLEVVRMAGDEKAGAADLARVIRTDPVIAANILKLANSAYFAGSNRTISSAKEAVVRIGFRETRRMVMSMAVMELFDPEQKNAGFSRLEFWHHCIAMAVITEHFARRSSRLTSDEAFLIGLLRNFGIILLDEFFPGVFSYLLRKTTDRGGSFISTEKSVLGITHHDIVNKLFSIWNIPDGIRRGVTDPLSLADLSNKNDAVCLETIASEYACHVAVAECIAKAWRLGTATDQVVAPVPSWVFEFFHIPAGIDDSAKERIVRDLDALRETFNIRQKDVDTGGRPRRMKRILRIGVIDLSNNLFLPWKEYLRSTGHAVTDIEVSGAAGKIATHDCILINADHGTLDRYLEPVLAFLRGRYDDRSDPVPSPAAILLLVDEAFDPSPFREFRRLSAMYNTFDLRQIDLVVASIARGHRVGGGMFADPSAAFDAAKDREAQIGEFESLKVKVAAVRQLYLSLVSDTRDATTTAGLIVSAAEVLANEGKVSEAISMVRIALESYNKAIDEKNGT